MGDALDDDQAFEAYEMEPDVESGEEVEVSGRGLNVVVIQMMIM